MTNTIAGIDIHKRVLMVVVIAPDSEQVERRKFGATTAELTHLLSWLQQRQVEEVVMESTAQYWKPVWYALEGHLQLHLAQAWSNRAPRGKKTDFKDAERLVRRHLAGELTLSFVPEAQQRQLRSLTRRRAQLSRDRVRIQNQVESLLEENPHQDLQRVDGSVRR
jgi:transposase